MPHARAGPVASVHGLLGLSGPDGMGGPELLAALVSGPGSGPPALARAARLLERFGSLRRLSCATEPELRAAGLTPRAAARLAAAFALGRRALAQRLAPGEVVRCGADLFDRYHAALRDVRKERFVCVLLDAKQRVLREDVVSEGGLTSCPVHPREVFASAIREAAQSVVFVHNHPSGDPEPSPEDHAITRRLAAVGDLVGIAVLDHVVVGDAAFVSFRDRGWL